MKRMLVLISILFSALLPAVFAFCQDAPRIKKEDLRAMLHNSEVIIVDVRLGSEWSSSNKKIAGAIREDPEKISSWLKKYPKEKTLVFYCS